MNIDFYFDYGSPTSYLAHARMPGIAERTGAEIRYRPVLLGGLLQAAGNVSPMDNPVKRRWMIEDLEFTAGYYGIPFAFNPHFPVNTLNLMRGAIHAERNGFLLAYSNAIFQGLWVEQRNLGDAAEVRSVLGGAGLDADAILQGTQDPLVKETLKQVTAAASARGLFGAPVLYVNDRMFFGQDRLQFAEDSINAAKLATAA